MEKIQRLPTTEGRRSLVGILREAGEKIKKAAGTLKTDLPPDDPGTLEQILKPDWLNEFSQPSEDK